MNIKHMVETSVSFHNDLRDIVSIYAASNEYDALREKYGGLFGNETGFISLYLIDKSLFLGIMQCNEDYKNQILQDDTKNIRTEKLQENKVIQSELEKISRTDKNKGVPACAETFTLAKKYKLDLARIYVKYMFYAGYEFMRHLLYPNINTSSIFDNTIRLLIADLSKHFDKIVTLSLSKQEEQAAAKRENMFQRITKIDTEGMALFLKSYVDQCCMTWKLSMFTQGLLSPATVIKQPQIQPFTILTDDEKIQKFKESLSTRKKELFDDYMFLTFNNLMQAGPYYYEIGTELLNSI